MTASPALAGEDGWINPWRTADGRLRSDVAVGSVAAYASLADTPPCPGTESAVDALCITAEALEAARAQPPLWPNFFPLPRPEQTAPALTDCPSPPYGAEAMFAADPFSVGRQRGVRWRQGVTVPLRLGWELAILNTVGLYRHDGDKAGVESLSLRLGAAPDRPLRPWLAVSPYVGLDGSDSVGLGVAAGVEREWDNGAFLAVEGRAFEAWDEGYFTTLHDGRIHGARAAARLPLGERLALAAEGGYAWLSLGPHAPDGSRYAGRRGDWTARAEWLAAAWGGTATPGFRDRSLWRERSTGYGLTVYVEAQGKRHYRPDGFDAFRTTRRVFRQRAGLSVAWSTSRFDMEARGYIGQDTGRGIGLGKDYGVRLRLGVAIAPRLLAYAAWSHDAAGAVAGSGDAAERRWSFGIHGIF